MREHRLTLSVAAVSLLLPIFAVAQTPRPGNSNPILSEKEATPNDMLQLGPDGRELAKRAGLWDVTFTSWDKPGSAALTVTGLVAERQMIGPMLQETLHPGPGTSVPSFTRVDDLTFNRIEGRWDYMSMDTRVANGLMSAWSLDHDPGERIYVSFQPFATAGNGPGVSGQMWRMEQVMIREDADHDTKDQYFTPADGTGTKWLAKRYSYVRRASS